MQTCHGAGGCEVTYIQIFFCEVVVNVVDAELVSFVLTMAKVVSIKSTRLGSAPDLLAYLTGDSRRRRGPGRRRDSRD
jgi:hypothetical protein